MGKFYYDNKDYPRWGDSGQLVHRTISRPSYGEVTHHRDGNTHNFRSSNLVNINRSEHSSLHARKRNDWW